MAEHAIVVCFVGGPGAGKGTQADLVKNAYGDRVGYMSAGDLLRNAAKEDTPLGHKLAEQLKNGEIVAQEVTIGLIKDEINRQKKQFYILDGFPRAIDQAQTFEKEVCRFKKALYFKVEDDVLVQRCLERGKTSGRTDDNVESLKKRLKTFHEICEPVNDYFAQDNRLVTINSDRSVEVIHNEVKQILDDIIKA